MRGVLLAVVLAGSFVPGAAHAGPLDAPHGSWVQARPVGAVPDVQSGTALPVQGSAAGVLAFSAVQVPTGSTGLSLVLVDGGTTATPVVWACPVTSSWHVGDRQPWAAKPAYDCSAPVVGVVKDGLLSWQATGSDLALVPGDSTPFSVSFLAPTASSFSVPSRPAPVVPAGPSASPSASGPVAGQPLQAGPLTSEPFAARPADPLAPAPPVVSSESGIPVLAAQPSSPASVAGSSRTSWVGAALLALLAFLLMLKTALPAAPLSAPSSLLLDRH